MLLSNSSTFDGIHPTLLLDLRQLQAANLLLQSFGLEANPPLRVLINSSGLQSPTASLYLGSTITRMTGRQTLHAKRCRLLTKPDKHPNKPIRTIHREFQKHEDDISKLVQAFAKLHISSTALNEPAHSIHKANLNDLPQEILLNIVQHFAEPWALADELADWTIYNLGHESRERQRTLLSLCKTSRSLCAAATTTLYYCVHLRTTKSVRYFLRALRMRNDLSFLVKQISCPHPVLMRLAYIFAPDAFDHDTIRLLSGGWINERSKRLWLDNGNIIGYQDLFEILFYIPHVRTLSVPRSELGLITGPWGGGLVRLEHLTKLSISLHVQPSSRLSQSDPHRVLRWLNPVTIAATCPALEYLQLLSPYGKWQAEFTDASLKTTGRKSTSHLAGKYIKLLSTISNGGCVQWDLMTLKEPVFHPSWFHTLHFAGPNPKNVQRLQFAQQAGWNLNTFLHTKGEGIRVLTLDWDTESTPADRIMLFGLAGRITTLKGLTNLTHLTVSLQVLYPFPTTFFREMSTQMALHAESEINRLFPSSLKVLRIDEYMPAILGPPNRSQTINETRFSLFTTSVRIFISMLRHHWLCDRGDRELWFRRYRTLDEYDESPRQGSGRPRRVRREFLDHCLSPQDRQSRRGFMRVSRSHDVVHPQP